jgi:hypothetical protein
MNALSWLNQLRLLCNHGLMQSKKPTNSGKTSWNSTRAQKLMENMLSNGSALCALCYTNLADAVPEDLDARTTELPSPRLFKCLQLVCGSCISDGFAHNQCPSCLPSKTCVFFEVSLTPMTHSKPSIPKELPVMSPTEIPTKVLALVSALKFADPKEKRYSTLR